MSYRYARTADERPQMKWLGVDGWANLVVGVLIALALADLLPKIPW